MQEFEFPEITVISIATSDVILNSYIEGDGEFGGYEWD